MRQVILALLLIGTGWALHSSSTTRIATGPLKDFFVDARAQETATHNDGPADFTRDRLNEMASRLDQTLSTLPLLFGLALLLAPLLRRCVPEMGAVSSVAILSAALGGGLVLTEQSSLIVTGWRDGLFTEDDTHRNDRFFGPRVVRAAKRIKEAVPPNARVLIIRVGVPRDLNALGYLIFPRRVFMPPNAAIQLPADFVRAAIKDRPDAIAPYLDAGYTHAIDLEQLIEADDPRAIVPFSEDDGS